MTIYHFEVVSIRREKSVKCSACGKRLKRAKTFDQTLNPYNRNARGMLKSREEIIAELRVEAEAWMKQGERCYLQCGTAANRTGRPSGKPGNIRPSHDR